MKRKRVVCPRCKTRVIADNLKEHKASAICARNQKLLARLTSKPRETFASIARDFGLSREGVRLIAQARGLDSGRERRAERRRRCDGDSIRWNRFFPHIAELAQFGVKVEITPKHTLTTANLNGKLCTFKSVFRRPRGSGDLSQWRSPVEFVLCRIQPKAWLVLPAGRMKKETMGGLDSAPPRRGRGRVSDDWRRFLNAWHLLKTEGSAESSPGIEGPH